MAKAGIIMPSIHDPISPPTAHLSSGLFRAAMRLRGTCMGVGGCVGGERGGERRGWVCRAAALRSQALAPRPSTHRARPGHPPARPATPPGVHLSAPPPHTLLTHLLGSFLFIGLGEINLLLLLWRRHAVRAHRRGLAPVGRKAAPAADGARGAEAGGHPPGGGQLGGVCNHIVQRVHHHRRSAHPHLARRGHLLLLLLARLAALHAVAQGCHRAARRRGLGGAGTRAVGGDAHGKVALWRDAWTCSARGRWGGQLVGGRAGGSC